MTTRLSVEEEALGLLLRAAIREQREDEVLALLQAGANPNMVLPLSQYERSVLFDAVETDNLRIVEAMVRHGSVILPDVRGDDPLRCWLLRHSNQNAGKCNPDVGAWLLLAGAALDTPPIDRMRGRAAPGPGLFLTTPSWARNVPHAEQLLQQARERATCLRQRDVLHDGTPIITGTRTRRF